MRIIRRPNPLRPLPPSAVTIGNFDGVHLGHQALLRLLRERAAQRDLQAVVVTFEPLPREYFAPDRAPPRVTGLREKLSVLASFGLDAVCVLPFDRVLAQLEPKAFARDLLTGALAARSVLIGHDFRFGRDRAGDSAMLARLGRDLGFATEEMAPFRRDGQRVSSTLVRAALAANDLQGARALLGRHYGICGRVAGGARLGRQLGFPTANISLARRRVPVAGVYAVAIRGVPGMNAGDYCAGVANVGVRPAVGGGPPLLEAHVFDYSGDLYGRRLEVQFRHFLRAELDFPDLDALRAQMREDARQARDLLHADGVAFCEEYSARP